MAEPTRQLVFVALIEGLTSSPLLLTLIGATAAILGGVLGAVLVGVLDRRRRRIEHRAAVRAVLQELASNLATFHLAREASDPEMVMVSCTAYSTLLIPLFSGDIPDQVASSLGMAYGRLIYMDKGDVRLRWSQTELALGDCQRALAGLMDYARAHQRMQF